MTKGWIARISCITDPFFMNKNQVKLNQDKAMWSSTYRNLEKVAIGWFLNHNS
jgi:hypothetical protein